MKFRDVCWLLVSVIILFIGSWYANPWIAFVACMLIVKTMVSCLLTLFIESLDENITTLKREAEEVKPSTADAEKKKSEISLMAPTEGASHNRWLILYDGSAINLPNASFAET